MHKFYYVKLAIHRIKGDIIRKCYKISKEIQTILDKNPTDLTENEIKKLFSLATEKGIDLFYFKKTGSLLPRVSKVIGILKSIYFESLLDIGSGRGAFLIPFLDMFPHISVSSMDILEERYIMLKDMESGGLENFTVSYSNICDIICEEKSVDIVTLLEVLEHIPQVEKAIENAVKIAREYVIVSVPSKEDDNEEHIHLLTKEKLTAYFEKCNITKISFDNVHGHLIAIVRI